MTHQPEWGISSQKANSEFFFGLTNLLYFGYFVAFDCFRMFFHLGNSLVCLPPGKDCSVCWVLLCIQMFQLQMHLTSKLSVCLPLLAFHLIEMLLGQLLLVQWWWWCWAQLGEWIWFWLCCCKLHHHHLRARQVNTPRNWNWTWIFFGNHGHHPEPWALHLK